MVRGGMPPNGIVILNVSEESLSCVSARTAQEIEFFAQKPLYRSSQSTDRRNRIVHAEKTRCGGEILR